MRDDGLELMSANDQVHPFLVCAVRFNIFRPGKNLRPNSCSAPCPWGLPQVQVQFVDDERRSLTALQLTQLQGAAQIPIPSQGSAEMAVSELNNVGSRNIWSLPQCFCLTESLLLLTRVIWHLYITNKTSIFDAKRFSPAMALRVVQYLLDPQSRRSAGRTATCCWMASPLQPSAFEFGAVAV